MENPSVLLALLFRLQGWRGLVGVVGGVS